MDTFIFSSIIALLIKVFGDSTNVILYFNLVCQINYNNFYKFVKKKVILLYLFAYLQFGIFY